MLALHFSNLQAIVYIVQIVCVNRLRPAQQFGFGAFFDLHVAGSHDESIGVKFCELSRKVGAEVDEI